MKFTDLFKRPANADDAFEKLESSLSDMLMVEFVPPLSPEHADSAVIDEAPSSENEKAEPADEPEQGLRTTGYTQARLAEFAAFEGLHNAASADLDLVRATLAKVNAAHHQTHDFLNSIHSGIHRTNELEIANAKLSTENRALYRQAEQVKRLRAQHESLVEAFKRRESRLVEAADALRASLANVKLELVEANSRIDTLEAERQEAMTAHAAAATQLEMTARENDMLRERQINLSADLETSSRKRTDAERKVDELTALHARDMSETNELRSKLAGSDAERQRLQKQHDALQSKLGEATEAISTLEQELDEQARRNDIGMQGSKTERETLLARLDVSAKVELEAAERIGALTVKLNDALAERRIAEDRLSALLRERETSEAGASTAVDEAGKEIAARQEELVKLKALVKKLAPYERLYKASKEREQGNQAIQAQNGSAQSTGEMAKAS